MKVIGESYPMRLLVSRKSSEKISVFFFPSYLTFILHNNHNAKWFLQVKKSTLLYINTYRNLVTNKRNFYWRKERNKKRTQFYFLLGFRHTSFAFQYESQVEKSTYRDAHIQPGALINIIHKGLQFMEIEAHMNEVRAFLK